MKRKKTIRVNKNKLDGKYKFLSKGVEFKDKSVCQLQENLGDGTGWFLGIRKTGSRNKISNGNKILLNIRLSLKL